jgi:hypothetical protein
VPLPVEEGQFVKRTAEARIQEITGQAISQSSIITVKNLFFPVIVYEEL